MDLRFYGKTSFGLKSKDFAVALNLDSRPDAKADVVLLSEPVSGKAASLAARVIDEPGEYEIRGLFVYGISYSIAEQLLIFKLEYDNHHICYLPEAAKLSEKQLDDIGLVDVLILPLRSKNMEMKDIKELIEEIDPRVIVPFDPQHVGSLAESKLVQDFLKTMNKTDSQSVEALQIDRYPFNEEKTDVVLLEVG